MHLLRRTRNRICIWVIVGGVLNLLAYTVVYAELGGDARNGGHGEFVNDLGEIEEGFFIGGHFIRGAGGGRTKSVSKWVWVYSYIHSISL